MRWHDLTETYHLIPCLWGENQGIATQLPACPHVHSPGPDPPFPVLDQFPALSFIQLNSYSS